MAAVRPEQRTYIKYNPLVAGMVILDNLQWMSLKLEALRDKGLPIDAEGSQALSRYRGMNKVSANSYHKPYSYEGAHRYYYRTQ